MNRKPDADWGCVLESAVQGSANLTRPGRNSYRETLSPAAILVRAIMSLGQGAAHVDHGEACHWLSRPRWAPGVSQTTTRPLLGIAGQCQHAVVIALRVVSLPCTTSRTTRSPSTTTAFAVDLGFQSDPVRSSWWLTGGLRPARANRVRRKPLNSSKSVARSGIASREWSVKAQESPSCL